MKNRGNHAVFVALLILASPPVSAGSPGCGLAPPATPGMTKTVPFAHDGLSRGYRLHLPAGYDRQVPAALVLNFHGYFGNALEQETDTSHMSLNADRNGYIVVYGQSTGFETAGGFVTSWNDLTCNASPGPDGPICADTAFDYPKPPECADPTDCDWCSCHDDVGYVDALLDELEASLCIDNDRIYATGMSNGGMFVYRLGCNLGHRLAAIAPVAGTLSKGFNCAPPRLLAVGLMNISGLDDTTVPPDGSQSSDGFFYEPVTDVVDLWASPLAQGCSDAARPYPTSADGLRGFACTQRAACESGAELVSCTWNAGHVWPSLPDKPQFGNQAIWEFFARNARRSVTR